METFKAPVIEIINPNVSPEIEGDNSVAYENWKAYEKAVEEGIEEAPKEIVPRKHERYEFNVDKALDCIDLTFNGYSPSRDAIEFFNIMRLVYGEDFETDNALMHYFLVDLVYGNIKRENFPYSQEINEKIRLNSKKIAIIASRFSAKSTIITAFMPIVTAITGKMPNFGEVMFWVSFGDSQQSGAKVQANTIRDICEDSLFCKDYFEKMRFTDEECEFIRKDDPRNPLPIKKRCFMFKVKGAAGGSVRGIRYKTERPQIFSFDDIIKNEADAGSAIIMKKLTSMIYSDAENALGKKGKIIIVNTPFNKKDPVYTALENGVWTPVCLPVCEKIYLDMPKSEYRGSWEAMKPYEEIMEKYEDSYYGDTLREFNQELMLRISSEEDKLIPDKLLESQWYKRTDILKNLYAYNLYMTTDFTTTGNKGSDLSGIAVWAVNHNQDWFMLDLCLRKQEVEQQYNEVFRFIDTYTPENKTFEVGVEVDGNQRSHIHALKDRMRQRMNYFTIARQRGSQPGAEGILSRLEGGNKHWRMRMMLPMFQNRKIFFPEELRHSPDMVELMDEIRYTSYTRFNCVSGDTLVDTPNGKIMMSDIRHNDSVLTQNGYTSVNSNASNPIITGVEQTYTITTIDGEMHLTAEHKVLTMRGYVIVKDLTSTDLIIRNIECKLSNMDTNGQDKKVDIINQQHQLMEKENGFIVKYMKEKMEKLKKDMRFIIKMKIKTITNLLILKYYRLKIISLGMLEEKNTGTIENKEEIMKVQKEKKKEKTETKIGFVRTVIVSLKSMIKLKMKQNSVANHAEENTVNFKKMRTILNLLQSNVLYAILNLNKNQQIKYAVQKSAEKYILKKTEEVKLSFDCACRATMNSKQLEALHESFAQKNVEILIETSSLQDAHAENVEKNLLKRLQNLSIAQIVASTSLIIKIEKRKIEPVYDFEVKGTNNFSSNNMVIHNCKHDDGMDLLSMINALEVIYPAKNMSYIPTKIKDGKVAADDIYGMINRHSDEDYSAYDSY